MRIKKKLKVSRPGSKKRSPRNQNLLVALALFVGLGFLRQGAPLMEFLPTAATTGTQSQRPTNHAGQGKVTVDDNDDNGKERRSASFCSSPEGSLHQIGLDMLNHSSPPGSASHTKLKKVLETNKHFYINLGGEIFTHNQQHIASMLEGYGLNRLKQKPTKEWTNVTLVELSFPYGSHRKSVCPIQEDDCANRTRIIIQSEQFFHDPVHRCHESPNCIVFEFSDKNYRNAQDKGIADSFALLPVMTQSPSRIARFLPKTDDSKPLVNRKFDIVFFVGMPTRRRHKFANATKYLENHPNRTVKIGRNKSPGGQAWAYGEAKVCLVVHSYMPDAGGEYHRLSEFAPFGCIPVLETFGDTIGIERYQECGKIVFAQAPDLLEAAANVTAQIDQGLYQDDSHVDWWKAGIQWETLLPSVLSGKNAAAPGA